MKDNTTTCCSSHRKAERKLEREKWQLVVIAKVLAFLTAWITHC